MGSGKVSHCNSLNVPCSYLTQSIIVLPTVAVARALKCFISGLCHPRVSNLVYLPQTVANVPGDTFADYSGVHRQSGNQFACPVLVKESHILFQYIPV